jgi:hypothetical protein
VDRDQLWLKGTTKPPAPLELEVRLGSGDPRRPGTRETTTSADAETLMGLATGEVPRVASVALRALRDIAAALEAHQVARPHDAKEPHVCATPQGRVGSRMVIPARPDRCWPRSVVTTNPHPSVRPDHGTRPTAESRALAAASGVVVMYAREPAIRGRAAATIGMDILGHPGPREMCRSAPNVPSNRVIIGADVLLGTFCTAVVSVAK